MKIIFIMSKLSNGGAERLVVDLVQDLSKSNEISIISLAQKQNTFLESTLENNRIRVFYCNKENKNKLSLIYNIYQILKSESPNIVHVHTSILFLTVIPMWFNRIKGKFYTIHNLPEKDAGNSLKKIFNKISFKIFNVIPVAISEEIAEKSLNFYSLKKIHTIVNGRYLNEFISEKKYETRNKYSLINVARFTNIKNQKLLIEAIYHLKDIYPNIELNLVGNGEEYKECVELVKKLDIESNIIFWGDQSCVSKFLNNSSIFILPSLYEGVPISIIEAMANGLPVIASNVGGIPTLVKEHKTGLLINPNDINALIEAIRKLIDDDNLRISMSQQALINSKKFDIEECSRQHFELYKRYV